MKSMEVDASFIDKFKFVSQIACLYLLTIFVAWFILRPLPPFKLVSSKSTASVNSLKKINIISGLPYRIVIPDSSWDGVSIDLLVDPGVYNSSTGTWTLSGTRAQFSMYSSLANNYAGETFIYGHNNDQVFGALRHTTPTVGSLAYLYTTNGHIFSYAFESVSSVAPDDPAVLNYQGPPIMIIQTCTGSFDENRTLYLYKFVKVDS